MDAATLSSLPPKLLAQYLRDPQSMMAQDMIKEGTDTSPIQSPWQGVARMAKAGLGGYMSAKLRKEYGQQADAAKAERSAAMAFASGKPAETAKYEDGTTINWNEQKPNYMAAASQLSAPDNQDLAGSMMAAKLNQDQVAGQQAFQQGQQERLFSQQKELADMTASRQQAMQEAALGRQIANQEAMFNRQMAMEQWKLQNDPQRALQQRILQGMGQQQTAQPPSVPQVSMDKLQAPVAKSGGVQPPQIAPQPQQPMQQSQGGVDPAVMFAMTGKMPEGYGLNSQGQFVPTQGVQRKLSPTEQKELFDTMDLVNSGGAALSSLQEANRVLNDPDVEPYTGFGAETLAAANRIPVIGSMIDDDRATATTNIKNAVSEQALNQLKAIFGGMPTEGERAVLMSLQALPSYTPQEQQAILSRAMAAAQQRLEFNKQKAEGIQTGNYKTMPIGQPAGSPSGKVSVVSPDGQAGLIDASELQQALANGWRQAQ